MNSASIIGNLGETPVVNKTSTGISVTTFSVATTEKWKKDGVKQEKTTWHKVQAWGNLADVCAAHLTKGSKLYVSGRMDNQTWKDKHGVEHTHWMILVMENMEMLGDPGHKNGNVTNTPAQKQSPQTSCPFTYEQMIAAGWTDAQLLTTPQYAHLVPKTPIPPPPPVANNLPPAPPTPPYETPVGGCAGSQGFIPDANDVGI